jgi:hypothetical protein
MDNVQSRFTKKNVVIEACTKVIKSTDIFGHNFVESIILLICSEITISRRQKLSLFLSSDWPPFQS